MHFTKQRDQPRVHITKEILHNFFLNIFKGTVSEFATDKGLPYGIVYNLVHGRVRSISAQDYRVIFGEEPPYQESQRVDGKYFRGMVRLWLFLNRDARKKDLYREFYPGKKCRKVDSRIFSGKIKTVNILLEKTMEQKFFYQGLERSEIKAWIEELYQSDHEKRVPYEEVKPVLEYLKEVLKIGPRRILNQSVSRYESGKLKTVPIKKHQYILNLEKIAEKTLRSGSKFEIDKLREKIYGQRKGMTLFSEIEDQLEFLRKYGGKSPNSYLGRSVSYYKKSNLIRIASWRAENIQKDCEELIGEIPEIQLVSLPKFHLKLRISKVVSVLKSFLIKRVIEDKSGTYERLILTPSSHDIEEYKKEDYGFVSMDSAAYALGMGKKAFGLMVATHANIFRRIARYDGRWYLSNLYIKELKAKEGFLIVKAKYELMATRHTYSLKPGGGEGHEAPLPDKQSSGTMVAQDYQDMQGSVYHLMPQGVALANEYFDKPPYPKTHTFGKQIRHEPCPPVGRATLDPQLFGHRP